MQKWRMIAENQRSIVITRDKKDKKHKDEDKKDKHKKHKR